MLDLDAGVDLEEIEAAAPVEQELHRARALEAGRAAEPERGARELLAHRGSHDRAGRLLQELLVAALDGAVPLAQVDRVAAAVGQDLHLDVPGAFHVLLEIDLRGPERRGRLALAGPHGRRQAVGVPHDPDSAPAAPQRRLQEHRIPEGLGDGPRVRLVAHGPVAAGQERHVRLARELARADLVPEEPDHLRARPDEADVARPADLGERRVLGEEAVAGMDRLGVGDLGGRDQPRDVQVALGAVLGPDADALVGEADGERARVGRRVGHDRPDPHLPARAEDPEGDLPAVGDQDLGEHPRVSSGRRRPGGGPRRPRR